MSICGTRGGKMFTEVIRVDSTTNQCPAGSQPCSLLTSPEYTVCYSSLEECPITFIKFTSDESNYISDPSYNVLNFTDG